MTADPHADADRSRSDLLAAFGALAVEGPLADATLAAAVDLRHTPGPDTLAAARAALLAELDVRARAAVQAAADDPSPERNAAALAAIERCAVAERDGPATVWRQPDTVTGSPRSCAGALLMIAGLGVGPPTMIAIALIVV